MQQATRINWVRIVAEGVAIVTSILLAFWIDAWWQERQLREDEQQTLAGLREEFLSNRTVLMQDLEAQEKGLQAIEDLLSAPVDGIPHDTDAVVEAALTVMLTPRTTNLGNGTLDAVLSSGRIENFRNPTLRANLAAWDGVIGEVWDDQDNLAKMVYEIYVPYFLEANISVSSAMRALNANWSLPPSATSEVPEAIRRLLQNPRFRLMAEVRYGYQLHLSEEFEAAIAAVDEILAEIEASVD